MSLTQVQTNIYKRACGAFSHALTGWLDHTEEVTTVTGINATLVYNSNDTCFWMYDENYAFQRVVVKFMNA